VLNNVEIRKQILEEAHNTQYSVHPSRTKMYKHFRQYFWWNNIKREIVKYVDKCLTCQKIETDQQHPVGELRPSEIPT